MPNKAKPRPCPYNAEVGCIHLERCERCGWNPMVAAQRKKQIRKKLGLPPEEIPRQED